MGAGSSTATVITNLHSTARAAEGNSSQSGSATPRPPTTQPTVSLGTSRALLQVSQRPVQLQHALPQNRQQPTQQRPNAAPSPNLHSRSQQVQTDSPENSAPRPLVRQVSQHNLPQARVVLRLPNDIADTYPREE
ncbi:Protein of unknown function [Gryllus bimaculatus]|nr:Protein of unknown function [Gryllus bimaculatus]